MRIEVNNLTFSYGKTTALDSVSFTVPEGSFTGLVGPNGSGKTTLFKLLTRVHRPDRGTIHLSGRDLASYSSTELARCMAVVTQDSDSGLLFTVGEMVAMGRSPYLGRFQSESAGDREIVQNALEATGCLHLRGRVVGELSGGERQRVMIARALAQQPKILLLDEPTSHLDIGYQQDILDLVKRLSTTEGMTVLAVLHDLNLAAYYCNSLHLLAGGRVCSSGPPAEVLTPAVIGEAYRTNVLVTSHPVLGTPSISLLPAVHKDRAVLGRRVHVLAGGGSGGEILRDLWEAGYEVATGVLNVGDSDWEAASALALSVVAEAPFSPVSAERHRENLDLLECAGAVVLSEMPVGRGNIRNLEAARHALKMGKPLFILEERPDQPRDYTGGAGEELLLGLKEGGAVVVNEKARLYRALASVFAGYSTSSISCEMSSERP